MSAKKLKPARWQRWAAWGGVAGLFLSGLALALPARMDPEGLSPFWDGLKQQGSRLHGALAMAFLVVLGALYPHVRDGLKARRNTAWGVALLASLGVLILTGWCLYYLPLNGVAAVHLWVGVALPLLIFLHAAKGRR